MLILMIVAEDPALKERFDTFFSGWGYAIIQYRHPIKAMDNMEEIHPDVLLCSASDYPRHWKLIIRELRESRQRDQAIAILTVPEHFEAEEANKAAFLGVNMLYPERLRTHGDFRELDRRIARYKIPQERVQVFTWTPPEGERVSFMFQHPRDQRIVTGKLVKMSVAGGIFRADDPADMTGLCHGDLLSQASIKSGGKVFSLEARIARNSGYLSLVFLRFDHDGLQVMREQMDARLLSSVHA